MAENIGHLETRMPKLIGFLSEDIDHYQCIPTSSFLSLGAVSLIEVFTTKFDDVVRSPSSLLDFGSSLTGSGGQVCSQTTSTTDELARIQYFKNS